jgi:hypothetical protein
MAVGAIADTSNSAVAEQGNHAKHSGDIAERRAQQDEARAERAVSLAEHRDLINAGCEPLVETDHAPFATDAEHKAFHSVPTDIDHTDDPVFSSTKAHRAFHGLPCGITGFDVHEDRSDTGQRDSHETDAVSEHDGVDDAVRSERTHEDPVATESGDSESAPGTTDDGAADPADLKEQPTSRADHDSREQQSSRDRDEDRSQRDEERSDDSTN